MSQPTKIAKSKKCSVILQFARHTLQEGSKALDIAQNEIHPHLALGEAYLALGRIAEAVAAAERAHRNFP